MTPDAGAGNTRLYAVAAAVIGGTSLRGGRASIFGAVIGGALGAYLAARRTRTRFLGFADAVAPGLSIGQALGRFGNWFNQELFGGPLDAPWALEIDPQHRPAGYEDYATFHPTFLYESVWNLGVAGILLWADRRWKLGHGAVFALWGVGYGLGRFWIEGMRTDFSYFLGPLRTNQVTALLIALVVSTAAQGLIAVFISVPQYAAVEHGRTAAARA